MGEPLGLVETWACPRQKSHLRIGVWQIEQEQASTDDRAMDWPGQAVEP